MSRKSSSSLLVVFAVFVALVAGSSPASAVTQAEVDAACSESGEALTLLRAAREERDEAQARYAELIAEREQATYLATGLRDDISERETTTNEIRDRVVSRAIDVYMSGGTEITDLVFGASSVNDLVAGHEFLEAVTANELSSADLLAVIRGEMEVMRADLDEQVTVLLGLEGEADDLATVLADSAQIALDNYDVLQGECKTLYDARRRELARARAIEAARKAGGGGGVPAEITPGFICPMSSAAVSYSNDWGNPRSGGRTHKGTDIFAPNGQSVFAVADGVISFRNGGKGGIALWLSADYGVDFYYAHLSGYAGGIGDGTRVSRGQVIASNGSTGNAAGGSPHLHFQLHPGGRSRAAVNPYPTLARTCG